MRAGDARAARLARAVAVVVVAAHAGCQTQPVQTPLRSFDRPSDVGLVCAYDDFQGEIVTLPLGACNPDCAAQPSPNPNTPEGGGLPASCRGMQTYNASFAGDRIPRLYALVPNSARGELAFVHVGQQNPTDPDQDAGASLIDLDPAKPGFGFLPIGRLPEALRVTSDGCRAVSANAGSCDLSLVDVRGLLKSELTQADPQVLAAAVSTVVPMIGNRPLGARPTWVEFAPPMASPPLGDNSGLHNAGTDDGGAGPTCRNNYDVIAAFPSCGLIARIALHPDALGVAGQNGQVVQAAQRTAAGWRVVTDLSTLRCASECPAEGLTPPDLGTASLAEGGVPVDAGALEGGAPVDAGALVDGGAPLDANLAGDGFGFAPTDGSTGPGAGDSGLGRIEPTRPLPSTFAIDGTPGNVRLFVGDDTGDDIEIIHVAADGSFGALESITLAEHPGGVTRVRLSPRIEGLRLPTEARAPLFLYAIARDRTIRVIDADAARECETNPDISVLNTLLNVSSAAPAEVFIQDFTRTVEQRSLEATLRCPKVDPATRSPLFLTPGIALPGGALPRDVSFAHYDAPVPVITGIAPLAQPGLLYGDFAWAVDSAGRTAAITLADLCPQPNNPAQPGAPVSGVACHPERYRASVMDTLVTQYGMTLAPEQLPVPVATDVAPHHLRPGNPRFTAPTSLGDTTGAPRLNDIPISSVGGVVQEVSTGSVVTLCNIQGKTSCANPPTSVAQTNFVRVHDPNALPNENWSVAWEGAIPGSTRSTGRFVPEPPPAGSPIPLHATLSDTGAPFCALGVEAPAANPNLRSGDILLLTGCSDDTNCGVNQLCYKDDPLAPLNPLGARRGFCLLRDPNPSNNTNPTPDDIATCAEWIEHTMRFHVTDVVQTVPAAGNPEGKLVVESLSAPDLCAGPHGPTTMNYAQRFACLPSTKKEIDRCFPRLQNYEVRAGRSFVVRGDVSGFYTSEAVDPATGHCRFPPLDSPLRLLNGRIRVPLDVTDPSVFCQAPVRSDWLATTAPGQAPSCFLGEDATTGTRLFHYDNALFSFVVKVPPFNAPMSTATISLPKPTDDGGALDASVADAAALDASAAALDAAAVPPGGPLAVTGCSMMSFVPGGPAICDETLIQFTTLGGSHPMVFVLGVDIAAQMPRSVVTGPDGRSLYVIDEGRQTSATGVRGQLLRFRSESQSNDQTFKVR